MKIPTTLSKIFLPALLVIWSLNGQLAHAAVLGNDVTVSYGQGTDGNPPFIILDGSNFDIPSSGTITGAEVHEGDTAISNFELLLLQPLGGNQYKVVIQDQFTTTGTVGNDSLSLDWNVTANEVLAYTGRGVAFNEYNGGGHPGQGSFYDETDSGGNPTYFATDPATGSTFTVYPSNTASENYVFVDHRDYGVNFTFVAAPEPGTTSMLLLGGLVLLGAYRFRRGSV